MLSPERVAAFDEAEKIHAGLLDAFKTVEDPLETDELLNLLDRWNELTKSLSQVGQEEYSRELESALKRVYDFNQEIGAAAAGLRNEVGAIIRQRISNNRSVNAYKDVAGQRRR